MLVYFLIILIVIYLCGIYYLLDLLRFVGVKDLTPYNVRMCSIWPIILLIYFLKAVIYLINEILAIFLLAIGVEYRKTMLYNRIKKLL